MQTWKISKVCQTIQFRIRTLVAKRKRDIFRWNGYMWSPWIDKSSYVVSVAFGVLLYTFWSKSISESKHYIYANFDTFELVANNLSLMEKQDLQITLKLQFNLLSFIIKFYHSVLAFAMKFLSRQLRSYDRNFLKISWLLKVTNITYEIWSIS